MVTGEGVPHNVMPPSDVCHFPYFIKLLPLISWRQFTSQLQLLSHVGRNAYEPSFTSLGFMPTNSDSMNADVLPLEAVDFLRSNSAKQAEYKIGD